MRIRKKPVKKQPVVLVCGGRDFDDWYALDAFLHKHVPSGALIIHGGAIGADFLARVWAKARGFRHRAFPADWNKHGKAAGPIRNQQMLDEGNPDLVLALPGDIGTPDMVQRARRAGVRVIAYNDWI